MTFFKKILKKINITFIFRLFLCITICLFLFATVGIDKLVQTFQLVNPIFVVISFFFLIILFLLSAVNVWLLLRVYYTVSYSKFLKFYSIGWVASLLTPGQAGDISLVLLLKKINIEYRHTLLIYFIDKSLTLIFFLIVSIYGFIILFPEMIVQFNSLIVLIVLLVISLSLTYFFCTNKFNLKDKILNNLLELKALLIKWPLLLINFSITIFKWVVVSFAFFVAFYAFDVFVKPPEICVIPIQTTLVGYIPISIAGIGTVEITAGYLFSKVGVQQSVVLSVYILMRSLQYILALALMTINRYSYNYNDIQAPQ